MSRICFVYPVRTISISVTGNKCTLNCLHCGGAYLCGMIDIRDLSSVDWAPSYLITGGCTKEGKVPIIPHLEKLGALPSESRRIAHTGLINRRESKVLADVVDIVSFDFVGDDRTIHEIYGLNCSVSDYEESFLAASSTMRTYPHLTIGLYKGRLAGETNALDFLSNSGAKALVLNVLVPTPGTALERIPPPPLSDVKKVIHRARDAFDAVYIGCMRPGGRYRSKLDALAVREGCDRIVNPSRPGREIAEREGLDIEHREECCIL